MSGIVRISGRAKDLGGFKVTRLLPHLQQRSVGPFIFLDHMGPALFAPGSGLDVRPHPHIGLATVTFLFAGSLMHRDSLGSVQEIRPGDVNWMSAGRGIVHSERSPHPRAGGALHGLQAWLALPVADEESTPTFAHYPAAALPRIERPGLTLQLIAGEAFGERSPVRTASTTLYLAGTLSAGAALSLPAGTLQRALYVVSGELVVAGQAASAGDLVVLPSDGAVAISATLDACIAILGGEALETPRHLWWNFVSSRAERIEQAKDDWRALRFAAVPDEQEFISLPD